MKTLLLITTTLLLLNVSAMAVHSVGATTTDCSDMSDITGADASATIDATEDTSVDGVIRA
jgi:hypothetical protein